MFYNDICNNTAYVVKFFFDIDDSSEVANTKQPTLNDSVEFD